MVKNSRHKACGSLVTRTLQMKYIYPALVVIGVASCLTIFRLFPVVGHNYEMAKGGLVNKKNATKHSILFGINFSNPEVDLMKMPKKKFLPNYKNPCWLESINSSHIYDDNKFVTYSRSIRRSFQRLSIHWAEQLAHGRDTKRLRCLPYFLLVGFPKSGTTDLYSKIVHHPDVHPPEMKEMHWWARNKIGQRLNYSTNMALEQYIDLFDEPATKIHQVSNGPNGYHHQITGEGSASTAWDNDFWYMYPENSKQSEPTSIIANEVYHLLPAAKVIFIVRNPTTRLYSDYLYFTSGEKSAEDFHAKCKHAVELYTNCSKSYSWRHCAYDRKIALIPRVRLRIGLYYLYIKDWMRVFPREQIHVLKLENYTQTTESHVQRVYDFLGLRSLKPEEKNKVLSESPLNRRNLKNKILGGMLQQTKQLLDNFYAPFNRLLVELLGDNQYHWANS